MRPPTTPEEIETSNKFHAYQRGWEHRASGRAKDEKYTTHPNGVIRAAYERGYEIAGDVKNASLLTYALAIGYDIEHSMLRG